MGSHCRALNRRITWSDLSFKEEHCNCCVENNLQLSGEKQGEQLEGSFSKCGWEMVEMETWNWKRKSEKWTSSGHGLKAELSQFPDGLDVLYEKQGEDNPMFFAWTVELKKLPSAELREAAGSAVWVDAGFRSGIWFCLYLLDTQVEVSSES